MKVIVSGGGTGGHIYPAVTIARAIETQLQQAGRSCEILYIGTKEGMEARIIPREGFRFEAVQVSGIKRSFSPQNIKTILKLGVGFLQAIGKINSFKPDIVVGTGGFVCGPILLAAALMGVPTIIQEQNALPGITNKILSRFVKKVCLGYREAAKYFPAAAKTKMEFTGNPIRKDILTRKRASAYDDLGLPEDKRTVLVVGGSRGARSINSAMLEVYKFFAGREGIQILHATGDGDFQRMLKGLNELQVTDKSNIIVRPYLFNMQSAIAIADVAVFRAGAVGLAELSAVGVPAILIPYPYAAENHQEFNARALEKNGAAIVILDNELTGALLIEKLNELLGDEQRLSVMARQSAACGVTDAAERIATIAIECAR
ncbi:MAG: undecaprenyldiphospho-muramoylpentapeptide beta-N-acetylglucosaminyltransferase [Negativicutes bacterium]|jgi:UDP-N-acetylglucosamine--N-acetylmuramyl-(pentapeptide) pyrophosphoryl-undecaprenol N-acetylglucosamine transferase